MPATTTGAETNNSLISATLVHRARKLSDAITKQLPLFWWFKEKGRYKPATGRRLEWPVWYKNSPGELSYQGFDIFTLQEVDDLTLVYAAWKHYHEAAVWSGTQTDVENTGSEQVIDLIGHKETAATTRLQTKLSEGLYADGLGNGGKDITGLDAIVPENPATGTLYGVNRATAGNEWMRSVLVDQGATGAAIAAYSGTPTVFKMIQGMSRIHQECGRLKVGGKGERHPDVAFCSEAYLRAYESCIVHQQRFPYTNTKAANAGFTNLMYKGVTIIDDQDHPIDRTNTGTGQAATWINSAFAVLHYAPKRNFKAYPARRATNQDAWAVDYFWSGELCFAVLPKHGRHIGIKEV